MSELLSVVAPVFLVIAVGYIAVRTHAFADGHVDALMAFTQHIAIPCLLFRAVMDLDLATVFRPALLISFYAGATISFFLGIWGARALFGRRPGEAVAIGFGALFSNSVMLGLPITERAFGAEVLQITFAVIAIHAPFCYLLGITVMEVSRADGRSARATAGAVVNAMVKNALAIGLALGFAVNLSGVVLPYVVVSALDMVVRTALPVALFALGGVLTRYRIRASLGPVAMVATLSLVLHPAITYTLSSLVFSLPPGFVQAATTTAAMAPGVNTYVFASLYHRAEDVAAAAVLLATGVSLLSVTVWLSILSRL
ncbi:MAG: AEC family transporter [Pseudomonadota bacterium]